MACKRLSTALCCLAVGVPLALPTSVFAQGQIRISGLRGGMAESEVRVTNEPPEWLASPANGRLATSEGVELAPLQNAGVSYENAGVGILIGAFRNVGTCLRDASVRLQYTDEQWKPLGEPIENEARVSLIEPEGLLPYRFRLKKKSELPRPPAGYLLEVSEAGRPVASGLRWVESGKSSVERGSCPARPYAFEVTRGKSKATSKSYQVSGTLRVVTGGPIRPDSITLTALLLDKDQQVLEVLTGAPDVDDAKLPTGLLENNQVLAFRLVTPVPLGKWVEDVRVFAEVLPEVVVAPERP